MEQHKKSAAALVAAKDTRKRNFFLWGLAGLGVAAVLTAGGLARAESHEDMIVSHGYSFYGDLKVRARFHAFRPRQS